MIPRALSQNNPINSGCLVTPAKAGVQEISQSLDSGLRRNDGKDFRQGGWLRAFKSYLVKEPFSLHKDHLSKKMTI
jgi:hypothetical protein